MKRILATASSTRLMSVAASLSLALALGACTVYDGAPSYPAYGAYPHSSSTYVFRYEDTDHGHRDRHRHHHRRDHRR